MKALSPEEIRARAEAGSNATDTGSLLPADVPSVDESQRVLRTETDFRAAGRCFYPLAEFGWRYSGRVEWTPPSATSYNNDEEGWTLAADPLTDQPGAYWFGSDYYEDDEYHERDDDGDIGERVEGEAATAGRCGTPTTSGQGLCPIHEGLPHLRLTDDAIESIKIVIRNRQTAADYLALAWEEVRDQ